MSKVKTELAKIDFTKIPEDEPAPNVLLMGIPGAGKTYSIATLLEAGMEVFVAFTEQGRESLLEASQTYPEEWRKRLHWAQIKSSSPGFKSLRNVFRDINTKDQKELQGAKSVGASRDYNQMLDMVTLCGNFIDQNGEEFGDVSEWGHNRAFVIDGLSSINDMCMDLVVGGKPIKTIADWGMAMDAQMRFIKQLTNSTTCLFALMAHLELNKDEITGKIYRYPKLLGQKNTYDFGKWFSDVILAENKGMKWNWCTQADNMQLKARNVGYSKSLNPSFRDLVERWAGRYK